MSRPSPCASVHVVRRGDTLSAIARAHGITLEALLAANPGIVRPDLIDVDDEVCIPAAGTAPAPGLRIVPRSGWGAKPYKGTPVDLGTVKWITVHHTATVPLPDTPEEGKQQALAIQALHFARGWSDVGYHFLLAQDGTFYQGRAQKAPGPDLLGGLALGSHVGGHNTGNVGVSVMGYFHPPHEHRLSAAASEALRQMLTALSERYDVPPVRIRGHREWSATACPGDTLFPVVRAIREGM